MWGLFAVELLLLKPRAVGNFPLGAFDLKKKGFVPFIISNHYCTHGWPWRGSTGTSADTHVLPPSAMKKAKKIQSPKEVLLMMSFDHEHLWSRSSSHISWRSNSASSLVPSQLHCLSFLLPWAPQDHHHIEFHSRKKLPIVQTHCMSHQNYFSLTICKRWWNGFDLKCHLTKTSAN